MLLPKSSNPVQERDGSSEETEVLSNDLWIGDLSSDVSQSDLMALFAPFGPLYSVIRSSARRYGFVFFKNMEDAKAAKNALQGTLLQGNPVKIKFARPAKPCKNLWVGGISLAVTKEELEAEFREVGEIKDFKILRDKSTACVEYHNLDDATQAMKIMNGKCIGGDHICVDYFRSESSRKDLLLDYGKFQGKSLGPTDLYTGQKRPKCIQSSVNKEDGQPSNILWIGYPSSVQIDEQMLHNAMILFGEIERITCYPSRNYSFVEFKSMDEARCAKEGLQGRLFNDPRITIMYSSSKLKPGKDFSDLYPRSKGLRPDIFLSTHQFQPLQMDVFGHSHPMVRNNFPGQLPLGGVIGSNAPMRPYGPQGSNIPLISGPELDDPGACYKYQDGSTRSQMGPNWKRPSPPASGMLPYLSATRPATRSSSIAWDVFDIKQCQGDSKRSRMDGALLVDNATFPLRNFDDCGLGPKQSYGIDPVISGGVSGPYVNIHGNIHLGSEGSRITAGVPSLVHPDIDHIWRGVIAKGGTPVCYARCIPVGKGIGIELPEVVDCSARAGLDMLTKHYADAIGFEIVFFLPDSEDDFASYTEFLCYLSTKYRAGIAKLIDGTTLFLIPPSDFLTKVLKVTGPERLYGVVLKFPQVPSSLPMKLSAHFSIPSTINIVRQHISYSQAKYGLISAEEEQVLQMDFDKLLHEESKTPPKDLHPATSVSSSVQSGQSDYASSNNVSVSQAGVTLTPELIATLASLLPSASQTSATDGTKSALGSSTVNPSLPSAAPNDGTHSYLWKEDHRVAEACSHPPPKLGKVYNLQSPHFHPYLPPSTPGHPSQMGTSSLYIQDSSTSQQLECAVSSGPVANFMIPSQSGQIAVFPQVSQLLEAEVSPSTEKEFEKKEVQSSPFGADEGESEVEADRNQRYQSTLQLAASLLRQIQQQQQQQQQT